MSQSNKKDFVILPLARWDAPYSSTAFSLAKELSKTNRVFYFDNPFTIIDLIRGWRSPQIRRRILTLLFGVKACRQLPGSTTFFCVTPPVVLSINFLSHGVIYNSLNRFNNYRVNKTLRKICRRYHVKDFIYLNIFNPFYLNDIKKMNPICSIYYCVDNMVESKYIKKHGVAHEQKLMRESSFTISTSKFLQKYAAEFSKASHYLPNAADFSLFNASGNTGIIRPRELEGIKGKVVGYIGNVEDRIDFDLLYEVATLNPDKIFLFIGPINSIQFEKKGFNHLPNMISTGRKKIEELPGYLKFIDCAIIPFKRNKLTEGIYPLKINEYLAAGRPVVCTSFSEDILGFKDIVQLADTAQDFSQAIQVQIDMDSDDQRTARINRASENTWADRAAKLKTLVANYS